MKQKILFGLLILFSTLKVTNAQPDVRIMPNNAFSFGEKINYHVKYSLYMNVPVGEVSFEVQPKAQDMNGNQCYHITAKGKTYSFYDVFFKIRDNYECFLEANSILPLYSSRDVNEGHYSFNETVIFNNKDRTAKSKKRFQHIPDSTLDVLSTLYYARAIDFAHAKEGQEFMLNTFIDDSAYRVGMKYIGKEVINTDAGKFRCIKLKPLLVTDRIFKSKDEMTLWITDDENHIPVQVESGISVGSIKVMLHSYENLHSPLTSKL